MLTNKAKEEKMLSENMTYRNFLEVIKIEMGDFLRHAEAGRTVRHASLRARKQSIKLREILKEFRQVSLNNDRRIAEIILEAKTKINEETGADQ